MVCIAIKSLFYNNIILVLIIMNKCLSWTEFSLVWQLSHGVRISFPKLLTLDDTSSGIPLSILRKILQGKHILLIDMVNYNYCILRYNYILYILRICYFIATHSGSTKRFLTGHSLWVFWGWVGVKPVLSESGRLIVVTSKA